MKEVLTLKNYINGEWVEAKTDEIRDVVNPATMKIIARVPRSGAEDVDDAIQAAHEAFPKWRRTPPVTRARYLFRLKTALEECFEELSRIQTMEHGKTIDESRGETRRGIEMVEVACGIPSLMMGYNLEDIARGIDEYVLRQPLGVFGCIAPFNFPFMVPLWFLPFAIATGNTFVLKPSSEVPNSQTKLHEILDEIGLPPGVVNMVHGGREVVSTLISHPDIRGISFVGSTHIGKNIVYKTASAHGKRVQAQTGAKNYMIIMPDCDIDRTARAMMTSFFGNTGQRCLSGANLVIVGEDAVFYNRFMKSIVSYTKRINVGYGLDERVQMGPVRSPDKKQRIIEYIEGAIDDGCKFMIDGRKPKILGPYPDTCFLNPTILKDVTNDMKVAQEEIFGPVMNVIRTKNLDDAIALVHENPYGNASSIFTSNGAAARKFQYEVEVGNVGINIGIAAPMAFFPFSGMKDSFFGDRHGQGGGHGFEGAIGFYTESKVVISRWW
ncbi:MAG: CoA-acylating methylmalonate-semialdehyde dehydrogenase [Candidatus Bathyarchaeota archaeon]|nr:MAG: CoA-acylating methylmalonate-semialdehyde dehydrogenase [Candidatus Bathyarchaeota archaeon]